MSYAIAAALQEAVFARLLGDTELTDLVGDAIYDALPKGKVPPIYVALGPEDVRARGDATGGGAWHRFSISVVTEVAGFRAAKAAAAAISDCLVDAPLVLGRGRLVSLIFERARARREGKGDVRRIDLTFRARVEDDV